MAGLKLERDRPIHELAADLRRAFSGIVAGNVKEPGYARSGEHGPFQLRADAALLDPTTCCAALPQQDAWLNGEYTPCYELDRLRCPQCAAIGPSSPAARRGRGAARLDDLLERAQSELMIRGTTPLPRPNLSFYEHRLDAGRATPPRRPEAPGTLEINAVYLARHPEEMLHETIAHELAHLIVFHLHPRRRQPPHGALWSGIMRDWFCVQPERTHRFDANVTSARASGAGAIDARVANTRSRRFATIAPKAARGYVQAPATRRCSGRARKREPR